MNPISETKLEMIEAKEQWFIPFMNFVDDFRYHKDINAISKPFELSNEKFDALLASTIEYLCNELHINTPDWVWAVPACKDPWFVSGVESIKAFAIVESPVYFRRRKIFVLENFLYRV